MKFQFLQLLEGDRSQSRLPFKIFSTLNQMIFGLKNEKISREIVKGDKAISVLNPAASLRFMQFEKKVLTISSSLQIL